MWPYLQGLCPNLRKIVHCSRSTIEWWIYLSCVEWQVVQLNAPPSPRQVEFWSDSFSKVSCNPYVLWILHNVQSEYAIICDHIRYHGIAAFWLCSFVFDRSYFGFADSSSGIALLGGFFRNTDNGSDNMIAWNSWTLNSHTRMQNDYKQVKKSNGQESKCKVQG